MQTNGNSSPFLLGPQSAGVSQVVEVSTRNILNIVERQVFGRRDQIRQGFGLAEQARVTSGPTSMTSIIGACCE